MKPQFEIEVEYESLERIELIVIQDIEQDLYWRINWDRISDKLLLDHQFSCDKPLPKGAMDEAFVILNERLDLLHDEYNQDIQEREEQRDMYVYNGVRRSDFF